MCVSLYVCQGLSVGLTFCQSVFLPVCLSASLFFRQSVFPPVCLSASLSFFQSVFLSFCQSFFLSVCLSVSMSFLSVCIFVRLSFCQFFFITHVWGLNRLIHLAVYLIFHNWDLLPTRFHRFSQLISTSEALQINAGYTANPVAYGWAGAVFEVTWSLGQEDWGQRPQKPKKRKVWQQSWV